jgi:hypothetical protein
MSILGTLDVFNKVSLCNSLNIQDNLDVDGIAYINSNLYGNYAYFSNINIDGTSYFNGEIIGSNVFKLLSNLEIYGDATFFGKTTLCNTSYVEDLFVHSNATFSNIVNMLSDLYGFDGYFRNLFASNLDVDTASFSNLTIYGTPTFCNSSLNNLLNSNASFYNLFASNLNGGSATFSNLTIYGTPTFCNSDVNNLISSNAIFYNLYSSNSTLSNVVITGPIYLQDGATISNSSNLLISGSGGITIDERTLIKDLVVYGSITLCNGATTSNIGGGNNTGGGFFPGTGSISNGIGGGTSNIIDGHFTACNVIGEILTEMDDTLLLHNHLYVCKNIYTLGSVSGYELYVQNANILNNLNIGNALISPSFQSSNIISSNASLCNLTSKNTTINGILSFSDGTSNSDSFKYWEQKLDIKEVNVFADLTFQSRNGSIVTFSDDFHPEVLNFTGKHRCVFKNEGKYSEKYLMGKLVVTTGQYCNLQGENKISMDEAIPEVRLCSKAKDSCVFGVFAGFEDKGEFHIGNITFKQLQNIHMKKRAIIQSVGEGCMWVCDVNGQIKNGDFLCSSPIKGYGMKQLKNNYLNSTIAKSTCRCTFSSRHTKKIMHKGVNYKCNLIGVTYKM